MLRLGLSSRGPKRWLLACARAKSSVADSDSLALPAALRQRTREAPLADSFAPERVEDGWQQWWQTILQSQASRGTSNAKRFSMILPPPNVTGALHIGHALTVTIQDVLARWHMMKGFAVTWVPGLDHAGIATQSVVERKLFRERGLTRLDLGRDEFVRHVWDWNDAYGDRILHQIDGLGCIVNKQKHFFTLDPQRSKAVNEAFVRLYEKGLVYRKRRMVNWCPTLQTAISDIEVDAEQLEGSVHRQIPGCKRPVEFGVMHRIKYRLADAPEHDEFLLVDTTRPETIFGDVAVAVHPEDQRYKKFHHRFVLHPFSNVPIPIVKDATLVNMELGTGVVKVTPAHDPKDFECGLRHGLDEKQVINEKGQMCGEIDAKFIGLDRFEARHQVIEALQHQGLYVEKRNHPTTLNICSRSGNVVEPLLKPQWFVKCKSMGQKASDLVRNGQMPIEPAHHKHTWFYFMDNLHDWCVSRQLWWGHRVPAYKVRGTGDEWIVAHDMEEALRKAREQFGDEITEQDLEQDTDVLDTWFSSGLLPLSAFGWPDVDPTDADLRRQYPLSVMETGSDILFFWVARMTMLCHEFSGQQPFKKVLLHPMVRDKGGRKMSKSLGNVIDPIDVIHGKSLDDMLQALRTGNIHDPHEVRKAQNELKREFPKGIPPCGADALRLTLASYLQQGRQINMDVQRVVSYRHFCNKVWNAFRFALPLVQSNQATNQDCDHRTEPHAGSMTVADRWILSRVAKAVIQCNDGLETNQLAVCVNTLQKFFVSELCDVYVEFSKPILYGNRFETQASQRQAAQWVLHKCLDLSMRLLHPFAPFLTEELWQRLDQSAQDPMVSLLTAPFPEKHHVHQWIDIQAETQMQMILDTVRAVRSLRHVLKTLAPNNSAPKVFVTCSDPTWHQVLTSHTRDIQLQTRLEQLTFVHDTKPPTSSNAAFLSHAVCDQCQVLMQVPDDLETCQRLDAELQRVAKKQMKLEQTLQQLQTRLEMVDYESKVPAKVRHQEASRKTQLDQELAALVKSLATLQSLRDQMINKQ